jgi:hypothetical protein
MYNYLIYLYYLIPELLLLIFFYIFIILFTLSCAISNIFCIMLLLVSGYNLLSKKIKLLTTIKIKIKKILKIFNYIFKYQSMDYYKQNNSFYLQFIIFNKGRCIKISYKNNPKIFKYIYYESSIQINYMWRGGGER